MNKLVAGLLAGAMAFAAPFTGIAQEVVQVGEVTATRVVIAPPQNELARIIKSGLSAAYYGATKDSRAYAEAQGLYFFYGARNFEPLWLAEDAGGKVAFSPAAQQIIEVFKDAETEGFRSSDYLTADLDVNAAQGDALKLAALETAFSAAAMRYANHAAGGRIRPTDVYSTWTIAPRRVNEAELLVQLAASAAPDRILLDLHPRHGEFLALKAALANMVDDGGVPEEMVEIPDGAVLKPGMTDARVPLLRQRLDVAGALDNLEYDDALVEAIKLFQESLGLDADGITGPATVAALNGGAATTRDDIIANMERWRWLPEDLGDFHVMVNIPEFRLAILDQGQEVYTTRVVVGTSKNQTPSFSDEIEHIVVNPYWNVPSSIANNEIGPLIVANPGYIASQNMELLYNGEVVNASAVDWSTTSVSNFRIRQRPGAGNALGRIKFLFPNQHDVYLHDTPSKSLFSRSFRAYSHGCIRVQNPMEFAGALLAHTPDLTVASLEGMFGSQERWVNLPANIPVHITYFTLRIDADGTIRSYGDVYGANKKMIALLNQ